MSRLPSVLVCEWMGLIPAVKGPSRVMARCSCSRRASCPRGLPAACASAQALGEKDDESRGFAARRSISLGIVPRPPSKCCKHPGGPKCRRSMSFQNASVFRQDQTSMHARACHSASDRQTKK